MSLINGISLGLKHQKNILWAACTAAHTLRQTGGFTKTVVQDLNGILLMCLLAHYPLLYSSNQYLTARPSDC